jgi:hypothetical protein
MRSILLLVLAGSLTLTPAAEAAGKRGTFSGTLGVKVAKGSSGAVRAVSLADLTVVAGKDVSRSGAFSLSLPAGSYLVLGDNRGNSSDSAAFCRAPGADDGCWRWATRDGLVGRAAAVIWPIPRWAGL